jgi:hypothetical protein
LIEKHLLDAAWVVKARAIAALAALRSREAIPVMIARLKIEEGRPRSDLSAALTSLTGQNFRGNAELWQRWWNDNEAKFQVPALDASKTALEAAVESVGVSFFGITTESQRVLFVVDCSLSMNFSMTPKNNPGDEPGRPYDTPDESKGEYSRLTAAKRDLEKALGGIRDGGEFNIVCYAADVWAWDDAPAVMSPQTRKEALDSVGKLEGKRGSGPGEFTLPHNLAVDGMGRVYVTDRENRRIQVFDSTGKFLKQWADVGGISALFLTKEQQLWGGGTLFDLDGKVIGKLPGGVGGHGVAVAASGDVYVAQLSGVVQKFIKE